MTERADTYTHCSKYQTILKKSKRRGITAMGICSDDFFKTGWQASDVGLKCAIDPPNLSNSHSPTTHPTTLSLISHLVNADDNNSINWGIPWQSVVRTPAFPAVSPVQFLFRELKIPWKPYSVVKKKKIKTKMVSNGLEFRHLKLVERATI